ncbi:MAG: FAD-binding oxidoreductase, partial [Gammaproteobacteria bacterium]|nr:FAD-binding oxidoreductase [Gammaproteobacteria bacterium]NNL50146.1 FAD-binding oxidoreductase [Woeseiaceae bacterium]
IATAYYLSVKHGRASVLLIDSRAPMSYTSAQSGDNFRNWWPHPTMTAFTNDSIDLMQSLAVETRNRFNMTDRGYVLATRRADIGELTAAVGSRIDVDVFSDPGLIGRKFPALSDDIRHVVHVKRGGDFSGQQLGQYMLEQFREAGGKRLSGDVTDIRNDKAYAIKIDCEDGIRIVEADVVINAAGPFIKRIGEMLGVDLPVINIYQQKIAFDDKLAAIPRDMPFSIDLDEKELSWTDEERALLAEDPECRWLTQMMPAGTHCRPEGGERGTWVKLGWAYNQRHSEPQHDLENETARDPQFPEIVMRGAAALLPSLTPYIQTPPARFAHYGGYYTMTTENWPLIGPMGPTNAYIAGAMSGFGSMSACAAGNLCAAWVCGRELPDYATLLSLKRRDDATLMAELEKATNKGLL